MSELNSCIQKCAERVNAAQDDESRCVCQEELCKLFLQAEDYDHALQVAHAISDTPNANPERRAAHHFLIAQIYAMKMEASPSVALMEENRRAALQAAEKVIQRNYPEKWGVNQSAQGLLRQLNDPRHMAEVRAWVEKRQGGGADAEQLALARAQSRAMDQSVNGDSATGPTTTPSGIEIGFVRPRSNAVRVKTEPAREAALARMGATERKNPETETGRSASGGGKSTTQGKSAGDLKASSARSTKLLSEPIIIDGTKVRKAARRDVDQTAMGRPWPTSSSSSHTPAAR